MRVVFRRRAEADLRRIIDWYMEVAPEAVPRILDDIYRKIDFLSEFPRTGMTIPGTPFFRTMTRRYRFKIAYELSEGSLSVVGIYRYEDRQS